MLRNYAKPLLKHVVVNISKPPFRQYNPRRAVMYVPGSDLNKLKKALGLDIDCIVMDCEDGVALNKKAEARANIKTILDKGKPEKRRKYDLAVRVNSLSTEFLIDDLTAITSGKNLPDTILLPKVEESDHLKMFSDLLNQHVKSDNKLQLVICIESAMAFVNLEKICRDALTLSKTSKFTPAALLFGSDDFCASIGSTRTESSQEVLYARQKLVLFARAFDFQCIDMVYIRYKDLDGLKQQVLEGVRLGFTGKQVIHPGQVPTVQESFLPSRAKMEWAAGLIKAFHQHQQDGKGAFSFDGQMIDMPTIRQAQNTMELINAISGKSDKKV